MFTYSVRILDKREGAVFADDDDPIVLAIGEGADEKDISSQPTEN